MNQYMPIIACISGFLNVILVVLGGILAGLVGIWTSDYTRKRQAISQMIAEVNMLMTLPKDMQLHSAGERLLQIAIWRGRPFLSDEAFRGCLGILADYQKIDPYELAQQKEASFIWSRSNGGRTIEDRLAEIVDRLAEAIRK